MLRSVPSIPQRFVLVALGGKFAFGDGAPAGYFQRPPGLTNSGILAEWWAGAGPARRTFGATGWDDADWQRSSDLGNNAIFQHLTSFGASGPASTQQAWFLANLFLFANCPGCFAFAPSTTQSLPNIYTRRKNYEQRSVEQRICFKSAGGSLPRSRILRCVLCSTVPWSSQLPAHHPQRADVRHVDWRLEFLVFMSHGYVTCESQSIISIEMLWCFKDCKDHFNTCLRATFQL